MGLFVGSDGSYRGWLAALLCCCAVNEGEDPMTTRMDRPRADRTGVCNKQPACLRPAMFRPTTAILSYHNEAGFDDRDRVRPIAERPPSLKPLDFGEPSLLGRVSSPVPLKSSNSNLKRISISQPMAFRRLDYTERQRCSLIPLQLEPVTLRDSVVDLENDLGLDHETQRLTDTPGSLQDKHLCRSMRSQSDLFDDRHRTSHTVHERQPGRPILSSYSSSSSMRSLRRLGSDSLSSSSSSPHQSIDWSRLSRKRNSVWKPSSDGMESDVEREILELNTIVEEQRSGSSRSRSSDGHISAIAPLMSMKARPETLHEIGSAFSRPRPCNVDGTPLEDDFDETTLPMDNRLSQPFTEMPDLSALAPESEAMESRPKSKVGGWISSIIGASSKPVKRTTREDFYSCRPSHHRAVSDESTVVSELDSPIQSQWSHSHSRALTAESVMMTPASTAPSTGRGFPDSNSMAHNSMKWSSENGGHTQVGLAM